MRRVDTFKNVPAKDFVFGFKIRVGGGEDCRIFCGTVVPFVGLRCAVPFVGLRNLLWD